MAEKKLVGLAKVKDTMIKTNEKFLADQAKNADIIRAKDQVATGKVNKSTTEAAKNNQALMEETYGQMLTAMKKPLIKGANFSAMQLKQQEKLQTKMSDIFANVAPDGVASAIESLAAEVTHIPGAIKVLTEASEKAKKNDSKLAKLKAKEEKVEANKPVKLTAGEAAGKIGEAAKSGFDKIKGMLMKGALLVLLTQLPKILNSPFFLKIKEYFTSGTFMKHITFIWENVLSPVFQGIMDVFSIVGDLFSGNLAGAMETFKNNWMIITPIIVGLLIYLGFVLAGFIMTIKAGATAMFTLISPILTALAPIILAIALIVAAFFLFKVLLEKLRDSLGVGSIMDLVFIAWGFIKDGLAHLGNIFVSLANMIVRTVNKVAGFFGLDVDLPELKKFDTNNGAKALEKAQKAKQLKDAELAKKKAEEEKQAAVATPIPAIVAPTVASNNTTAVTTTNIGSTKPPAARKPFNVGELGFA